MLIILAVATGSTTSRRGRRLLQRLIRTVDRSIVRYPSRRSPMEWGRNPILPAQCLTATSRHPGWSPLEGQRQIIGLGPVDRGHMIGERQRQHLVDMADRNDLERLADLGRDLDKILSCPWGSAPW